MNWRRGLFVGVVVVVYCATLSPPAGVQAFGPYETLYMAHLAVGADTNYEFSYVNDTQNHAFTFDVVAGDRVSLESHWLAGGTDDMTDPWIWIVEDTPPVVIGNMYTFDFEAADILPKTLRSDNRIEGWVVPRTGTYTLHVNFYPYENGHYRLRIIQEGAAPESATDWTGEFPQLENGDRYMESTINGNLSWSVHSFLADPGDMVTILAWSHGDTLADRLSPHLVLCKGGCSPANADALISDAGEGGIVTVNYQIPTTVPANTLYTALIDGGTTTGDYSIWMRQWQPGDLLGQFAGGVMGELARTENGNLKMNGLFSANDAYKVHSFLANPGDTIAVTVTAKRETPADELVPVVLLVPGGYVPGEQWLALDVAEDTVATLQPLTIPDDMPADRLYTVVVADTANLGQLLFADEPVFGYAGSYQVVVSVH
jgi:hypothetical protein